MSSRMIGERLVTVRGKEAKVEGPVAREQASQRGPSKREGGLGEIWARYAGVLEGSKVPVHHRPHYARWVRQFAKTGDGRLDGRTREEVAAYLEELGGMPHLERWQVEQARDAIEMFYKDVLGLDSVSSRKLTLSG